MSHVFPELEPIRVRVDPGVRARHLAAIDAEIATSVTPKSNRRRLLAIALATVLLLPVVALAAESSAPGDFLYPFKRAFEPVVQIFDDDIVATHRVGEVETLISRDASRDVVDRSVTDARDVVIDHPFLRERLERAIDEARRDDSGQTEPSPTETTTATVTDRAAPTPVDTTTTTVGGSSDRPYADGRG